MLRRSGYGTRLPPSRPEEGAADEWLAASSGRLRAIPQCLGCCGDRQDTPGWGEGTEQIDVTNAGQIREELLLVINHGATALIADMTATVSCDHAGADAVVRAYQRAVVNGIQLRL